jgi:uncharacterized peroxidase-related enzyme
MPHIALPAGLPGIRGPMTFRPETAKPLNELANVLLHGPFPPGSLSAGERELIAAFVSSRNDCTYCQTIHGAVAAAHLGDGSLVVKVKTDPAHAPVSEKLRALLVIAGHVQRGGQNVSSADVEAARAAGATDIDIHDTVLIAAAFCMYNRYVDGLGTTLPEAPDFYTERAEMLARDGYGPPVTSGSSRGP